jgi:hypothetical protein
MRKLFKWVAGPLTTLANKWVESRDRAAERKMEAAITREFMENQIKSVMVEDEAKARQLSAAILRRDRGDDRTSWIRPVTAALALIWWGSLTLSQMVWVGYGNSNALLPIVWHIPPGLLGQAYMMFPMGVLATFYVARPFEKHLLGKG